MFRIKMMSKAIRFEGAALFKVEGLMTNMVGWGAESTSPHISAPTFQPPHYVIGAFTNFQ
jgi:hypothetical protein